MRTGMNVKDLMVHSLWVAWKDLMELFRNKMGLIMLILMPLFMMGIVGFTFPSGTSLNQVPIALANEDQGYPGSPSASEMTITTLRKINNNTDLMSLTDASDLDEVRTMIQNGQVEGGIIIGENFTSNLINGKQGNITLLTDQSNPQMSMILETALNRVFDQIGKKMAQQKIQELTPAINSTTSLAIVEPYHVQTKGAVPGQFSYFDFIAPGLMAMTVMMSVMTGLPAAISQEKEVGTLDGMMVAPINRFSIILGKTLAQMSRGLLQGGLILTLAVTLFGVSIHGNPLLIFGLLLLAVFSFVGLGVVITSFAEDQETAMMVMMTLMFPMMFLSGVFFPIQQMPWYMQSISNLLPLTYAADALREVMLYGVGITQITPELTVLIGFGTVMTIIGVMVFKRAMTR